jgi:hypothetical protein
MDDYMLAALKLHHYVVGRHWNGQALIGPDTGIRFNYRIGRFIKSYLRGVPWRDDYYYLQGQGYWVLANWRLLALTGQDSYRDIALRCSECMLTQQRDDGAWEYPNVEWKGRVATVEGTWASLGLLESYRQTGDQRFLRAIRRWHRFLIETIGFQHIGDELAVNYFANRSWPRVPNNSANVLRLLAELADASGDAAYLQHCVSLLTFLRRAQMPTGELPYQVDGVDRRKRWSHHECFQYNAFQCLELMRYHETTADTDVLPMIAGLLSFLRAGVATDGHALFECGHAQHRAVTYHTAALAAAFARAGHLGINGYHDVAQRSYSYLFRVQRRDGSFAHSRREYHLLSDQRSYPRYLSMVLYFLLEPLCADEQSGRRRERGRVG